LDLPPLFSRHAAVGCHCVSEPGRCKMHNTDDRLCKQARTTEILLFRILIPGLCTPSLEPVPLFV
jgi:hypothetical protein